MSNHFEKKALVSNINVARPREDWDLVKTNTKLAKTLAKVMFPATCLSVLCNNYTVD